MRLVDRIGVGALLSAFPPELVDEVLAVSGARERRSRKLPAQAVAYYAMAYPLFSADPSPEVWGKLLAGLAWARCNRQRWAVEAHPSAAALTKARQRLGSRAMAGVLAAGISRAAADPTGSRILVLESFVLEADVSPANVAAFGASPRVRVVALADQETGGLRGVRIGPPSGDIRAMARLLLPKAPAGAVVVGDSAVLPPADLGALDAAGVRAVARLDADASPPAGGRVVASGHLRLATTLDDSWDALGLYRGRWRLATAIGEVGGRPGAGSAVALRSRTPELVMQEAYGLFCVYQAVRNLFASLS